MLCVVGTTGLKLLKLHIFTKEYVEMSFIVILSINNMQLSHITFPLIASLRQHPKTKCHTLEH